MRSFTCVLLASTNLAAFLAVSGGYQQNNPASAKQINTTPPSSQTTPTLTPEASIWAEYCDGFAADANEGINGVADKRITPTPTVYPSIGGSVALSQDQQNIAAKYQTLFEECKRIISARLQAAAALYLYFGSYLDKNNEDRRSRNASKRCLPGWKPDKENDDAYRELIEQVPRVGASTEVGIVEAAGTMYELLGDKSTTWRKQFFLSNVSPAGETKANLKNFYVEGIGVLKIHDRNLQVEYSAADAVESRIASLSPLGDESGNLLPEAGGKPRLTLAEQETRKILDLAPFKDIKSFDPVTHPGLSDDQFKGLVWADYFATNLSTTHPENIINKVLDTDGKLYTNKASETGGEWDQAQREVADLLVKQLNDLAGSYHRQDKAAVNNQVQGKRDKQNETDNKKGASSAPSGNNLEKQNGSDKDDCAQKKPQYRTPETVPDLATIEKTAAEAYGILAPLKQLIVNACADTIENILPNGRGAVQENSGTGLRQPDIPRRDDLIGILSALPKRPVFVFDGGSQNADEVIAREIPKWIEHHRSNDASGIQYSLSEPSFLPHRLVELRRLDKAWTAWTGHSSDSQKSVELPSAKSYPEICSNEKVLAAIDALLASGKDPPTR